MDPMLNHARMPAHASNPNQIPKSVSALASLRRINSFLRFLGTGHTYQSS